MRSDRFVLLHSVNATIMPSEASFLQARQARTESRNAQGKTEKTERLSAFWISFKLVCQSWKDRLVELSKNAELVDLPLGESLKRNVQLELNALADELRDLKRMSLSSSSRSLFDPSLSESNRTSQTELSSSVAWPQEDDLTATDIRLLHRELTQCQTALDSVRNTLLPKGKFIFARYRKALEERQLPAEDADTPTIDHSAANAPKTAATLSAMGPLPKQVVYQSLQELADATVTVGPDDRVDVVCHKDASHRATIERMQTDQLVLRNIANCTVALYVDGTHTTVRSFPMDETLSVF
jgi:hypothetical protein